jgi:SAM-dependent methyltransferase
VSGDGEPGTSRRKSLPRTESCFDLAGHALAQALTVPKAQGSMLQGRPTRYTTARTIIHGIDEAMASGPGRPWQNRTLGQAQDVRPWIEAPATIDPLIVGNLGRFMTLLPPSPRVLDVGCYGGYCYDWLERRHPGLAYTGIDVDAEAIEAARTAHAGSPARFAVGDLFDLEPIIAEYGPFDAALCLRVVIHTPYLYKSLQQLSRAAPVTLVGLRIGGKDEAREILDEVSGERHFWRAFSADAIARSVPAGIPHRLHFDHGYHSLVLGKSL